MNVQLLIQEFDHRLDQYRRVVNEFPPDKLWQRPQAGMVSLGNMICHLAGSMRDCFENGIGQGSWKRDRQFEFDREGGLDGPALIKHLDQTRAHCGPFLQGITDANCHETRPFRNQTFTVYDLLLLQVVHVAYHGGQAAFLRRIVGGLHPAE